MSYYAARRWLLRLVGLGLVVAGIPVLGSSSPEDRAGGGRYFVP